MFWRLVTDTQTSGMKSPVDSS